MNIQPWLDMARTLLDRWGSFILLHTASVPAWVIPLVLGLFLVWYLVSMIVSRHRFRQVHSRLYAVERSMRQPIAEQEARRRSDQKMLETLQLIREAYSSSLSRLDAVESSIQHLTAELEAARGASRRVEPLETLQLLRQAFSPINPSTPSR